MKRCCPLLLGLALSGVSIGVTYGQVNSREGNALIFQINDNEYARISATNGNLGVGTTNPLARIHFGNSVAANASETNMLRFWESIPQSKQFGIGISSGKQNYRSDRHAFWVPSATPTEVLTIEATGSVGISNTSPIAKLDVAGNISVTGMIDVGHTAQACATAISGSIRYETTSDTLQICTSSGWKSLISTTTAAVGTLDGAGSANHIAYWNDADTLAYDGSQLYWDATKNWLAIGSATPGAALAVTGNISATGTLTATGVSITTANGISSTNGYFTGNVGIGTAAPSRPLEIQASVPYMQFQDTDSGDLWSIGNGNGAFTFYNDTDATSYMVISAAGNVGIGSDIPGYTLEVSSTTGLKVGTLAGTSRPFTVLNTNQLYASNTPLYINWTNSSSGTIINGQGGNVAIGNAAPKAELDVTGDVSVSGVIDVGHTALACSTTISGSIRFEATSDTIQVCTSAGWKSMTSATVPAVMHDGTGSANHIAYWTDADTLSYDSSQLYWDATKNWLGVGSAAPGAPLSVAGDISSSAEIYSGPGTAAVPAHSFTGDTNTGLYAPYADAIGFAAGGADYARITAGGISVTNSVSATNGYFAGNVGINTSPITTAQLLSAADEADKSYQGIYGSGTYRTTVDGTHYYSNYYSSILPIVSSGVSNTGYIIGFNNSALRSNVNDIGTLTSLYGMNVAYGHYTGTATARKTTNAYGVVISPYAHNGTITNMYDLLLGPTSTGGTVTNHYALYQSDAAVKNYFGGNVGIGTTSPGQKLTVAGTIETTSGGVKFPDATTQTSAVNMTTGTYTGNGAVSQTITLGFRPKLLIIKGVGGTYRAQTVAIDGIPDGSTQLRCYHGGCVGSDNLVLITSTGFTASGTANDSVFNYSGTTYYYFAIR